MGKFTNINDLLWHLGNDLEYLKSYLKDMEKQYDRITKHYKGCARATEDKNRIFVLKRDLTIYINNYDNQRSNDKSL